VAVGDPAAQIPIANRRARRAPAKGHTMKTKSISMLACLVLCAAAGAQPTAFTYQGRLKNGTQLATGPHDLRFRLWDAASGGNQLGQTQCADNVTVTEGVFTTPIDFGQQFATTSPRFLEIEVRADTGLNCLNAAGFTVLAPRQLLTQVPAASHANSAFALDAPDGAPLNAVSVDNAGSVGIGTVSPQAKLHVLTLGEGVRIQGPSAGADNLAFLTFVNGAGTRIGYVGDGGSADNSVYLTSDAGDVHLYTAVGAALTATSAGSVGIGTTTPVNRLSVAGGGADISGNVGIGTTAPGAKLDVRGEILFGNSAELWPVAADHAALRIVHGRIPASGLTNGSGFSSVRAAAGTYTVTFTPPFGSSPTVTATVLDSGFPPAFAMVLPNNGGGCRVRARTYFDGSTSDRDVYFIAIGPR
jgi:hypothetical protein